jgi:hypothetical protein
MGNWLDRSDLSSRLPEFIALFEARVNRKLAVRQQVTSTTLTPSSGDATLPADYLAWKKVTWTGDPNRVLTYMTPEFLDARYPNSDAGTPINFTIVGSTLSVKPLDATDLDFVYAQKVPALSDSATTNWLLTSHPDAYLFGSLTMAATLTGEAENGSAWNALAEQSIGDLWSSEFRNAGTMQQRVWGQTP